MSAQPASERAIHIAARCWTERTTSDRVMDPELAKAFALAIDPALSLVEFAWGLISNAGEGDWTREAPEWSEAAFRWRDAYHRFLEHTLREEDVEP